MTFEQFQNEVKAFLPNHHDRLQFKDETTDPRLAGRTGLGYTFQDGDHIYYGGYSHGVWTLNFNGGYGQGGTLEDADQVMQADLKRIYSEMDI